MKLLDELKQSHAATPGITHRHSRQLSMLRLHLLAPPLLPTLSMWVYLCILTLSWAISPEDVEPHRSPNSLNFPDQFDLKIFQKTQLRALAGAIKHSFKYEVNLEDVEIRRLQKLKDVGDSWISKSSKDIARFRVNRKKYTHIGRVTAASVAVGGSVLSTIGRSNPCDCGGGGTTLLAAITGHRPRILHSPQGICGPSVSPDPTNLPQVYFLKKIVLSINLHF